MNHISNYFFFFHHQNIFLPFVLVGKERNLEATALQSKQMFFPFSDKMALPGEMSLSLACQTLLNRLHESFWLGDNEQTQICSRWLSLPVPTASVLSGTVWYWVSSAFCVSPQTWLPGGVSKYSEKMVMKFWMWLPWFNLYERSAVPECGRFAEGLSLKGTTHIKTWAEPQINLPLIWCQEAHIEQMWLYA